MRYIIKKNQRIIAQLETLTQLKEKVGFTRQHFYQTQVDGKMKYKGELYEVIDVVELFYKLNPYYIK